MALEFLVWRKLRKKRKNREQQAKEIEEKHWEADSDFKYALKEPDLGLIGKGIEPFFLDAYIGCGWLPKYDYPVQVVPFTFNLAPYLEIAQKGVESAEKTSNSISDDSYVFKAGGYISKAVSAGSLALKSQKACVEFQCSLYTQWVERQFEYEVDLSEYCCFHVTPDKGEAPTVQQMEQFWTSLATAEHPMSFEIIADGRTDSIIFQFLCHKRDRNKVAGMLSSYYSGINKQGNDEDYLRSYVGEDVIEGVNDCRTRGYRLGLYWHYTRLLQTYNSFQQTDPLTPVINNLASMLDDEQARGDRLAVIQVLVSPSQGLWENHLRLISEYQEVLGGYWPEFLECDFKTKASSPLFAIVPRVLFLSKGWDDHDKPLEDTLSALDIFANTPDGNQFHIEAPLADEELPDSEEFMTLFRNVRSTLLGLDHISVFTRNTYSHGCIVNLDELVGLCHFPSKAFQHPKLLTMRTDKVPEEFTEGEILIGVHEDGTEAYVPSEWRRYHAYVVGYTGQGKTTLLQNVIKQDVDAGRGVGVIDVKGTGKLIDEKILPMIPEHRIDDVVLFDMTDREHPIGFNLLDTNDPQRKQQILFVLKRATEASWTDQMETLFLMAIGALLNDDEPHTLREVETLIFDEGFRYQVVGKIRDPYNRNYWDNIFGSVTQATKTAINRRMMDILSDEATRAVLCQKRMTFDFKDIMDTRKIFLAKIPRGNYPITFRFFARILMSMFEMAAFTRTSKPEPFYLYIDEFQHFADETFEEIINEAREAGLYLTMSHQNSDQISNTVLSACMSTGTTIVFQVQPRDTRKLESFFGNFAAEDIGDLGRYHTLTRIGKASNAFRMRTLPPPEMETDFSEEIRQSSRKKYCGQAEPAAKPQVKPQERKDDKSQFFEE